jgi:glycine cleavage system H protein
MASDDVRLTASTRRITSGRSSKTASVVEVGITAFAVDQLGDITLVNLDVKVGRDARGAGKAFGTIESVKTLAICSPPSRARWFGQRRPRQAPSWSTKDCYGKAWMIAMRPSDPPPSSRYSILDARPTESASSPPRSH